MFSVLWSWFCATGEYQELPDEENMHCKGRLAEMLDDYANDLHTKYPDAWPLQPPLLEEEMRVLGESQGIWLPNFLSRVACLQLADSIHQQGVVLRVFMMHFESYPQLQISVKRAAQSVMNKMKTLPVERLREMVETKKVADHACNPEYRWTGSSKENEFMDLVKCRQKGDTVEFEGVTEELDVGIIDDLVGPHLGGIQRMLEELLAIVNKRTQLNYSIQLLREMHYHP
ncbi:hypothetical protein EJ110_NYTH08917 [Nymphaea thermarum]|nr:hypothetical protein EJ110_NYTH08917 [Nymphaea thermarum]